MRLGIRHLFAAVLGKVLLSAYAQLPEDTVLRVQPSVARSVSARARTARQTTPWVSMHTVVPSSCTLEADWQIVGLYYSFLRFAALLHHCRSHSEPGLRLT